MAGIKSLMKRVATAVLPSRKGNPKEKVATGVRRDPPRPLTHFEVRAKQLGKKSGPSCAPATVKPAVLKGPVKGKPIPTKGNSSAARGTVTRASHVCPPGAQAPRTYKV